MRVRIFYLVLVVALFTFQEVLFRLVFPVPEVANFNRVRYSMMTHDEPGAEVQPLSNASFTWASDPDGAEFVHKLNLYGFRDNDWPVHGDDRVMFIGDSFVEGFMAADDESIPAGFEAASDADGQLLEAMNLGTGAGGIEDYLAMIGDAVPIFRPQAVILVMYANDFGGDSTAAIGRLENAMVPEKTNPFMPRLYVVISKLVNGENVATRWHKKAFQFLPAADSGRSPFNDQAFTEYASGFVAAGILQSMQKGRFNPFVVNEYSNYRAYLPRPANLAGVIGHTRDYVELFGGELLVVHIPHKSQVSDYYLDFLKQYDENKNPSSLMTDTYQLHADLLRSECEASNVPFLDLTVFLREREAHGERMYWDYDEHMKAAAYRLLGEEIYGFWRQNSTQAGKVK